MSELFEVGLAHVLHQAFVLLGGHVAVEIVDRVDGHALVDHLVMEVGTRRTPRVARPGDSLWIIAQMHGTTVENLSRLNGLSNPNVIYPGQIIKVR